MIDLNLNPNHKELRQFSIALIAATGIVGGLLWWKFGPNPWSQYLWVGGPIVGLLGLAIPIAIKPLFIGLSVIAFPIGIVLGTVALAIVYYLMITPIGLVFRLIGRDPLHRKFDRETPSYWIKREQSRGVVRYFQQF
ncbi:MAG: SxtJ family membrane protein [Thermoanaerobaculia bacterium]